MKYPMRCDWLVFRRTDDGYLVENYWEQSSIELSDGEARFLRMLDGKRDPYRIDRSLDRAEVRQLLRFFAQNDLTRRSRFVSKSLFSLMYSVCFFRGRERTRRNARRLNAALMVSFLPVFIFGLILFYRCGDQFGDGILFGAYAGLALGLTLHEAGHAVAGTAYGARVFEAGVMLRLLLPCAYVLMDDRPVRHKLRRVQIYAAGVEMNLLAAGISYLLAVILEPLSGVFYGMALQNLLLAAVNVIFAWGFDGAKILGVLLGESDFVGEAFGAVVHSDRRRELWHGGRDGKAALFASVCVSLIQIALPALLVANIAGWIICIEDWF